MSEIQQQLVERITTLEQIVADLRTREVPLTRIKVAAQCLTGQSIPNATYTTVIYSTGIYDYPGSTYDLATGIYTVPVTGTYLITCGIAYGGGIAWDGIKFIQAALHINSLLYAVLNIVTPQVNAAASMVRGTALPRLVTGTTIELRAYQNSGSAQVLLNNSAYNFMYIALIP